MTTPNPEPIQTPYTLDEKIEYIKRNIRDYNGIQFLNVMSPFEYYSVLPYKIKKTNNNVYVCMCYIPSSDKLYTFPIEDMMFCHPNELYTYRHTPNTEINNNKTEELSEEQGDDSEITPWDDNSEHTTLFGIFHI